MAQNLKANDTVMIIAGDNKGTKAKIVRVDRENHKAMLEGIGVRERHLKKTYMNPTGGKKTVHFGIDLSNLKLVEAAEETKKADKKNAKAKKGAK
ncbi:MAG: KOW motif domain-containing protein [Candidatus Saccharibacteria bacterium]|nr:KOW motif domain-containing protein [Candidatus Saccharibacteria bacterium]